MNSAKTTTDISWREASNPRPADYKSAALPTELRQRESLPLPLKLEKT
jgi:hypothetical protein